MKSDLSGFHRLSPKERMELLAKEAGLTEEDVAILQTTGSLNTETANRMIENVVGTQELPFGIATNFIINGKDYLIPMVLEEPSVVAAASNVAKMCRPEGFSAQGGEPLMTGQIQIVGIKDMAAAKLAIEKNKSFLIEMANKKDPGLVSLGGGAKEIEIHEIDTIRGKMMILYLTVDVRDAMGANAINTMCEYITEKIEELTRGKARLRIVSNLATKRIVKASAKWKKEIIGEDAVEGVLDAYEFAKNDIYRCATHNKGIMNGIDAIALATAQDFRALEAGAHAYASLNGYHPLTKYYKDANGDLIGEIELPVVCGTFGGASRTNPVAKVAFKILGVSTSQEFSQVIAAVGLAQNFAAIRALATTGIQSGHMKLHAKNIAVMAGARESQIDFVSGKMVEEKNIAIGRAKEILNEMEK